MPMGPFHLMDEIGLDVIKKVISVFNQVEGSTIQPGNIFESVAKSNLLGKKGGKGFYHYDSQGTKGEVNMKIYSSPPRKSASENLIQKRLFYPMINEATKALEERCRQKLPRTSTWELFLASASLLFAAACSNTLKAKVLKKFSWNWKTLPARYRLNVILPPPG